MLQGLKFIGAGLAAAGIGGAAAGIGIIFAGFLIAVSRNPEKEKMLFSYAILGFALAEAMGLLSVLLSFIILFS